MRKFMRMVTTLLLIVTLSLQIILPVKAWDEVIACTVLGDSIAKGYSSDKVNKINCYGNIISDRLVEENQVYRDYANYAVNGLATQGLNEKILSRDTVKKSLNKSDIIFVTMGSNDLLNEFKKVAQDILNSETKFRSAGQAFGELEEAVKKNPLIVFKVIDALSKWDYGSFEVSWAQAMETISQQKKEGAQVIVTNIYNPIFNMNLPGAMNKVVEDIIKNMNSIIDKRASEFEYTVVNLFDSNIVAYVQGDGLHPSQEGQQIIADMVYKEIEDPVTKALAQNVDGMAVKGEPEDRTVEDGADVTEEKNQADTEPEKADLSSPEKPQDMGMMGISRWNAAGSIIIVLLLIFLIMYRRKNKNQEE